MNLAWPADQFYWAILDRSVLPRGVRNAPAQLGYLFESRLPVPIDTIHAVYAPIDDDRVLACGAPTEALDEADLGEALTLVPADLPPWVDDDTREQVTVDSLNLLTGPWLPPAIRRGQRRLVGWVAAAIVLCAACLVIGFERQRAASDAAAADVRSTEMDVYAGVLGESVRSSIDSSFPPEQRIIAEHRRLMQTRSGPVEAQNDRIDAALLLTAILERWPTEQFIETETISVTNGAVTLVLRVPDLEDVQPIADAFSDLPDWQVTQPQTFARQTHVDMTLRFTRTEEPS